MVFAETVQRLSPYRECTMQIFASDLSAEAPLSHVSAGIPLDQHRDLRNDRQIFHQPRITTGPPRKFATWCFSPRQHPS